MAKKGRSEIFGGKMEIFSVPPNSAPSLRLCLGPKNARLPRAYDDLITVLLLLLPSSSLPHPLLCLANQSLKHSVYPCVCPSVCLSLSLSMSLYLSLSLLAIVTSQMTHALSSAYNI